MLRRECISRRPPVLCYVFVLALTVAGVGHMLLPGDHRTSRERIAALAVHHIAADGDLPRARIYDPWGTPYRIYPTPLGRAVVSLGPDKVEHTSDDVTSY